MNNGGAFNVYGIPCVSDEP